jgi:hypothetical protein
MESDNRGDNMSQVEVTYTSIASVAFFAGFLVGVVLFVASREDDRLENKDNG